MMKWKTSKHQAPHLNTEASPTHPSYSESSPRHLLNLEIPWDKSAQYPCLPSFASACLVAVFSGVSGSSAGRFLDGVVMIPPMPFAMMELELSQVDPKWLHKQTMPLSGHVCKYSMHNSSC